MIKLEEKFNKYYESLLIEGDNNYVIECDSDNNPLSQTQSEYFKDSKIRDKYGRLQVCYHGSAEASTNTKRGYYSSRGMWFSNSTVTANNYNRQGIRASYLNIISPYIIECGGRGWKEVPDVLSNNLIKYVDINKLQKCSNINIKNPINILNDVIIFDDKPAHIKQLRILLSQHLGINIKDIEVEIGRYEWYVKLSNRLSEYLPNNLYDFERNSQGVIELNNNKLSECLSIIANTILEQLFTTTDDIVSIVFNNYRRKYDGIIFKNINDGINAEISDNYVIFMGNQEKLITNKNPQKTTDFSK